MCNPPSSCRQPSIVRHRIHYFITLPGGYHVRDTNQLRNGQNAYYAGARYQEQDNSVVASNTFTYLLILIVVLAGGYYLVKNDKLKDLFGTKKSAKRKRGHSSKGSKRSKLDTSSNSKKKSGVKKKKHINKSKNNNVNNSNLKYKLMEFDGDSNELELLNQTYNYNSKLFNCILPNEMMQKLRDAAESLTMVSHDILDLVINSQYHVNESKLIVKVFQVYNYSENDLKNLFVKIIIKLKSDGYIINTNDGGLFSVIKNEIIDLKNYNIELNIIKKYYLQSTIIIQVIERSSFNIPIVHYRRVIELNDIEIIE